MSSFLYVSLVTVVVGADEVPFQLYKELLRAKSGFFKAAIDGKFLESQERVIKLPEQDPETFKYFVHWLHTNSLRGYHYPDTAKPCMAELVAGDPGATNDDLSSRLYRPDSADTAADPSPFHALSRANFFDLPFCPLIKLYIMAGYLQALGLKDQIITMLIVVYGHVSSDRTIQIRFWYVKEDEGEKDLDDPAKGINLAWNMCPEEDHLRCLLMKLFCDNTGSAEKFEKRGGEALHPDFIKAMYEEMRDRWKLKSPITPWEEPGEICKYHTHDVPCLRKLREDADEGDDD